MGIKKTTMYKQGDQWIVNYWNSAYGCYVESAPMSYISARRIVGTDNCYDEECCIASHDHREF